MTDDIAAAIETIRERLLAGTTKMRGRDACWAFTKTTLDTNGYAYFYLTDAEMAALGRGRTWRAHAAAVFVATGEQSSRALQVRHLCEDRAGATKRCVRPDHLIIGTARENADDRRKKHKSRWKLSDADCRDAQYLYDRGHRVVRIAQLFDTTPDNIYKVLRNGKRGRRLDT
jgi:hypothetical protein